MKILQQLFIILGFTFLGKLIQTLFNLPVPGSVIGMLLLFIALISGKVKEKQVALVGDYLLEILSVFFLPAGVGLMLHFNLIKHSVVSLVIILFVSFVLSILIVGRVTQFVKRKREVGKVNLKEGDLKNANEINE